MLIVQTGLAQSAAQDRSALRETLAQLRALNDGSLPDAVPVASLFAARLDQIGEVEERLATLRGELAATEAQLAALREPTTSEQDSESAVEVAAERESLLLRRDLAAARSTYLAALAVRLREMPEAARRILPGIAEPRRMLRRHGEAIRALASSVESSARRLEDLALRLQSGTLVGFVREAREIGREVERAAEALSERGPGLAASAERHVRLVESLEEEGRALRRRFFVSLLAAERQGEMDALFLEHIEVQRRLQRSVQSGADHAELDSLVALSVAIVPAPERVGTVSNAVAAVDPASELVARLDALLVASDASLDGWRLAFENEAVTVLSSQASPELRRKAYAFSSTILRDLRSEASLAWERRGDWERLFGALPEPGAWVSTPRGRSFLLRGLGILAVIGAWWALWRSNDKIVVLGVRHSAGTLHKRAGIRYGTLVRWSGLVEAVLPVLFAFVALRVVIALLGGENLATEHLRAIGMPVFWYALGLQALRGATRRITRGRPALIEVERDTLPRLERSYARLGAIVATAAAIASTAHIAIGEGVIVTLVEWIAFLWVGIWVAWETIHWRRQLAEAWLRKLGALEEGRVPGVERRAAVWMKGSRWGFVLSLPVLLRLAWSLVERVLVELSRRTDIAELMQARRLRRMAARAAGEHEDSDESLPAEYLRAFPLLPALGEDDALLLPRDALVEQMEGQIERWWESRAGGSIALVGEKGAGKTTLAALLARRLESGTLVQHTLVGKPTRKEDLFRALETSLPVPGAETFEQWVEGLCDGAERVVILDEAHNIFLRIVGGYEAYDALVDLVNQTSSKLFWIVAFNSFTWRFLNESRARLHFFRTIIEVPSWSADDIRELIKRRNRESGFEVEFDELLLDGDVGSGPLELVEGADGFFRLLRDASGGNPRIATRLWLSSLDVAGEKKLRVTAFRESDSSPLDKLSDELLFALAAVCQHENLSTQELHEVLNVSEGFSRFALQYLREAELVVDKDDTGDRVTLAAPTYRRVLRTLRSKHLIFE